MQKRGENELNINEQITAQQVRLVGENIPEPGVYPIAKALQLADELELDLVEISASADPPVCKILDYQKYLYQKKKKAKEMKSNAAKVVIKEIRFGPNTDEHDFQFKRARNSCSGSRWSWRSSDILRTCPCSKERE